VQSSSSCPQDEVDVTEGWVVLASRVERLFQLLQGLCLMLDVWESTYGSGERPSSQCETVAVSGVGFGFRGRNTSLINERTSVCAGSY
jgi:hypothetical protein